MNPIALISGASRGLGFSLATGAASKGYKVYAGVRTREAGDLFSSYKNIHPVILDVTHAEDRRQITEEITHQEGRLDLLIHNAGINSSSKIFGSAETQVSFGSLTQEALVGTAQTNAVAPLLLTQELAPLIKGSGEAKIVAVSSWFASIEESGERDYNFGYTGSKALLNAYFRLAANALRPLGAITFMVNPGWMKTDMGGQRAERTPDQSAEDIFTLIEKADSSMIGAFVDWNGAPHPW